MTPSFGVTLGLTTEAPAWPFHPDWVLGGEPGFEYRRLLLKERLYYVEQRVIDPSREWTPVEGSGGEGFVTSRISRYARDMIGFVYSAGGMKAAIFKRPQ